MDLQDNSGSGYLWISLPEGAYRKKNSRVNSQESAFLRMALNKDYPPMFILG